MIDRPAVERIPPPELLDLPEQVLCHVLQCLNRTSLCSFAQCSRQTFNLAAQRCFWEDGWHVTVQQGVCCALRTVGQQPVCARACNITVSFLQGIDLSLAYASACPEPCAFLHRYAFEALLLSLEVAMSTCRRKGLATG